MKTYSPGASIKDDYAYICDCCENDDCTSVLVWRKLPKRRGHFSLCYKCIEKLFIEHVSGIEKSDEKIIVKRQIVTEKLRNEIFNRDGNKCVLCNSKKNLCLDHIIPFSKGGKTEKNNLQTLCNDCNTNKRDK